jgi:hypothetical protein
MFSAPSYPVPGPGKLRIACLWCLLVTLALPAICAAQEDSSLREANRIYETGDIDAAIRAYQAALTAPSNPAGDVLHIHRRLGLLLSATGATGEAQTHFAIAIAMAPNTPASAELSPEQREHWEQTRAAQLPIEIRFDPMGTVQNTSASELRVEVLNTPAGAVDSIHVRATAGGVDTWNDNLQGPGPVTCVLPQSAWNGEDGLQVQLLALNPHGGVIAETRSSLNTAVVQTVTETRIQEVLAPDPDSSATRETPAPPADNEGSLWSNPWFWTITGVLVAGGVTTAVVLSQESGFEFGAPSITYGATP